MLRVGADIGLFTSLTKSPVPLKVSEIAELTTSSPQLLGENIDCNYLSLAC
jgi:hypothetical protein